MKGYGLQGSEHVWGLYVGTGFIFKNNCEIVNLLNVFHHKLFFRFFCYWWKKTTVMKSLSIYFVHHTSAFLNSFLNTLNKYNVLILNKFNLE